MYGEDLVQTCLGPVIAASVVWTELSFFRGPFSPSVLCPLCLLLHLFCLSYFGILWALRGGILGDISLKAVYSKVAVSLHEVWMLVSVFGPICCKRKLLWWWLTKTSIYEYSIISLKNIAQFLLSYLILYIFIHLFKQVLLAFSYVSGIFFLILSHTSSSWYRLHLLEWALCQIRRLLFTPTRFVPILH